MRNCVVCNKELSGKQKLMCSIKCRSLYWKNKLSGKPSFFKGKKQSSKQIEMMKKKGKDCIAWRGGKFNNFINRSEYSVFFRRRKNGFTEELFYSRIKEQDNKCSICKECFDESIFMKKKSADHCHNTNKARGVLCRKCNLLIGHAKDNIKILENSIEYLKFWQRTS